MYVKLLKWKYLGRGKLNTHNKNINLGRVREIKILRIFLLVGHPRDPKGEDLQWVSIIFESFKLKINTKLAF